MDERYEELLSKSIGEIREMLAYENSEATFESFLVENGWIEEEDDWEPDYVEEVDEIPAPEEGECNFEDGAEELDPESEELAQSIAGDIFWGKYSLEAVKGLYNKEIIDRINYLIYE